MANASSPQYVSIEYPLGVKEPILHCPICGQAMLKEEGGIIVDMSPCEHLSFVFVGEIADFEYQSAMNAERLAAIDCEDLDLDTLPYVLKKAGYGNKLLAFEITHGGMACGPVWSTEVYGFDFGVASDN